VSGLCHIQYSEGLVVLRDVYVNRKFNGIMSLTKPKTKEEIEWIKEKRSYGKSSYLDGKKNNLM
jgi:hypothetical protein